MYRPSLAWSTRAARLPVQSPQRLEIDTIQVVTSTRGTLWGFENHRYLLEPGVSQNVSKRPQAHLAKADVGVPVDATALFPEAVIEMQNPDLLHPNKPIELPHGVFVILLSGQRIPSCEYMAGVETETDFFRLPDPIQNGRELLKSPPQ